MALEIEALKSELSKSKTSTILGTS